MSDVLELVGASAAYGPFRALFDVDLKVAEGEAVALLGANGAGKSTIARVATGLVPLSAGHRRIDGEDATAWPAWRIRRTGILHVPEGRGIFSSLTVEENLQVAFLAQPRAQRRRLLQEALNRFELLGERRGQRAGTLSGGQQRLLSLAAALVAPPRLLVADELSLGLAPNVLDEVYASLRDLKAAGSAILLVEQQVDRALELCDVACVVRRGRIVASASPAEARRILEEGLSSQKGG